MKQPLQFYFKREKQEGMAFLIWGFLTIILATLSWVSLGDDFSRGMAVPLAMMGAIELTLGAINYVRSDHQGKLLADLLTENPALFVRQERLRMLRQLRNYDLYRWTGLTLCFVGLALMLASMLAGGEPFWTGFGAGLFVQSTIMLVLDLLAERRAGRYLASIEDLKRNLSRIPNPNDQETRNPELDPRN
jgi:hypothetical protein